MLTASLVPESWMLQLKSASALLNTKSFSCAGPVIQFPNKRALNIFRWLEENTNNEQWNSPLFMFTMPYGRRGYYTTQLTRSEHSFRQERLC